MTPLWGLRRGDGEMKLPNAGKAVIAADKLRDYLLNPRHKYGGPKARLLLAVGYRVDDLQRLEGDIRAQHLTVDVDRQRDSEYGKRYELVAPLVGPSGKSVNFRSVWQVDTGTDYPRLLTMYPE